MTPERIVEIRARLEKASSKISVRLVTDVADLLAEVERRIEDTRIAAGECRVQIPEPGTDAARLLSGNVLLRTALRRAEQETLEAAQELDEERQKREAALVDFRAVFGYIVEDAFFNVSRTHVEVAALRLLEDRVRDDSKPCTCSETCSCAAARERAIGRALATLDEIRKERDAVDCDAGKALSKEVDALRRMEARVRLLPDGYRDPYAPELVALDEIRRRR